MNAKKAADEKLRESLRECMQGKNVMLDEEMEQYEEHVFSDKFETEMKKLFVVRNKKAERAKVLKYAVSVAAALLVVVGIAATSITYTKATLPSIDILGWLDNYFEFSKGVSTSKDTELIFDEAQITYIPEGFVKTGENKNFTYIEYKYENAENKYFSVRVSKVAVYTQQDNEEIFKESFLNESGFEYLCIRRGDVDMYIWEDFEQLYYRVSGNIEQEELESVMNGIQYKGEIE